MSIKRAYKAGVTPKSVARRAAREAQGVKFEVGRPGWKLNVDKRRKDLDRLARLRARTGVGLVNEDGWIRCIANALRVMNGTVDEAQVQEEGQRLGFYHWFGVRKLEPVLVSLAVREIAGKAWGHYKLYSAEEAGRLLRLTTAERDIAEIHSVNSIDETRAQREARQKREQRAAAAALRPKFKPMSEVISTLAKLHQVSSATVYRRIESGQIPSCEIQRLRSVSPKEIVPATKILTGELAGSEQLRPGGTV